MSEIISIPTLENDAEFDCYVEHPSSAPKAAIIVIQEIFGVNEGIRSKCDIWAKAGYAAYAPDLLWRVEPGVELNPDVPQARKRVVSGKIVSVRVDIGVSRILKNKK